MEHRGKRGQLKMLESHKPLRNPVPLLNTRFPLIKNKRNTVNKSATIFPVDFSQK